jgi:hypothetical protein
MSSKLLFNTLPYYFKMVSPTLQYISLNKKAIFEGRKQISVSPWSSNGLLAISKNTVKRGKIGHLLTFKSKLKIVKSIFGGFFCLKSLYELWDL